MSEIEFRVEALPGRGFFARANGADTFTETDTLSALSGRVRDAVHCQLETSTAPTLIRLTIDSADPRDGEWRAE